MRPALAAVLAFAATPAAAQSDGEQIFRGILEALTAPQAQQQGPATGDGPQTRGARFVVTDLYDREVCEMVFSGSSGSGTVRPGDDCPGALGIAARWDQPGDDLAIRDSGNRLLWRGEMETGGSAWTGGAADSLRVYTIAPGAAAGPATPTPSQPQTSGRFPDDELYGDWRVTRAGASFGCTVTFERPDRNSAFAISNEVRTRAGCPGEVFGSNRWVYSSNVLTLTDAFGNQNAALRRASRDRWTGTSDGLDIVMTRQ